MDSNETRVAGTTAAVAAAVWIVTKNDIAGFVALASTAAAIYLVSKDVGTGRTRLFRPLTLGNGR